MIINKLELSQTFIAAGGQTIEAVGYMDLPITFENNFHIIKAYVIPKINSSLILGIDFWKKFNICPKYLNTICLINNTSSTYDPIFLKSYEHLTESQKSTADDIIRKFHDISEEHKGLGRTHVITHHIDTGNAEPIRQRYYRMSPEKQRLLCEELDEMLKLKVVEPCESPWSNPVLLTPKKDGKQRFCLDSRKLNSITKKDAYNLPYISEILDNLKNAKYLSSIDLSKSFWQIGISDKDKDKTAFYIPTRGTFRFCTMPFGLTNAPATQQRLVDNLFCGPEFENSVFVFLDDIIIISPNFEKHIFLLLNVLNKLKLANLTINYKKSNFFRNELKYLGYVVNSKGLHVDPEKVEAILKFPTPTNKKEVKRFLGTASWYRRFISNFSTLAGPLNRLTSTSKKAPPFCWSAEAEQSFNALKECLVTAPVLSCPNYDLPFDVHTDASNYGIGGLLTQTINGKEHAIAYMSRSLSRQECNYSITERETLAVLVAIEHWRCYLDNGKKFTVFTDHSALKWFLNLNNPTGRLARWGIRLSSFNFEIKHKKGSDNIIPDALSRSCPISSIDYNIFNTNDEWYRNIFYGCQSSPTSFPNYIIKNQKLYRYMKSNNPLTKEFEWKEVIPTEFRIDIIKLNHSTPTSAHFGIFKTYKRISLDYFWPKLHDDVVEFVTTCETCLSYKHQNHTLLGEMGRPKDCARPFQMISIDLVGPLPKSRKQNTTLLVITCCFSKYCLLFPIRHATAEIIVKLIEEQVFLIHGIPSTVIMDNGRQFTSKTIQNLFNKYKVPNVYFTPKYTPQINTVERYNKTIIVAVSSFIENDHRSWDTNLPKIQFAINSAVNEATGYTPSFLVFGRELVSCGSHYLDADKIKEIIFQPREGYVENLGHLSSVFNKVQAALLSAHSRNCTRYNLRRKQAEFNVGDTVWKRTYYQSDKNKSFCKKLAPKFIQCKVIDKKSPLVYELEDMYGNNLGKWHLKDIKLTNYKS